MSWDDGANAVDDWDSGSKPAKSNFDDRFSSGGGNLDDANTGGEEHGATRGGGGGDGGACRNCGEDGHFARECPEPKKNSGECYNCGETGHNKADCTNEPVERPFTGECRTCGQSGHRAADCPDKKPEICHGCGKEGHRASECSVNRKMDRSKIVDMEQGKAWRLVQEAAADKDMSEFKKAIDIYIKASGNITYVELEKQLRSANISVYCIAQEMEIPQTLSLVNLQGKSGCKNVVGYFFSDKPKRKIFADGWPSSAEENLERLADAGVPMENFVPQCKNCKEMGHMSKACTQDKMEDPSAMAITCGNCGEEGHRLRDCKAERQKRGGAPKDCRRCGEVGHISKDCPNHEGGRGGGRACHNCGEEDHISKDCPQPRKQICRNCNEEGHMSKECEKPKSPDNITCRNCEKVGHFSRDCPEEKDWSKVKCSQCGETGHTIKRCKAPTAEDNDGDMDGGVTSGGGMDGFGGSATPVANDGW